jgi:selenide,water dikinase
VGGHSIDDPEPKFGLSVTGLVDPARLLTNAGGQAGDTLVLTKSLGTGVLTTAAKRGLPGVEGLVAAVDSMTRLNAAAAEVAVAQGLRGATDVTGFGLIGHLSELLTASGLSAELWAAELPALPGAREAIDAGAVSGGTRRNLADTAHVDWGECPAERRVLACDAQTSGGLLLAVPGDRLDDVRTDLRARGVAPAAIGRLVESAPGADGSRVRVR